MRERAFYQPEAEIMKTGVVGKLPMRIYRNTTQFSTAAGTAEQTAFSYTIGAGNLNVNDCAITIRAWGTTAANANNKTIKLYVGAANISSGATAANNKDWYGEFTSIRTAAATQDCHGYIVFNGSAQVVDFSTGTDALTAAVIVKVTATDGTDSAADVTVEGVEILVS